MPGFEVLVGGEGMVATKGLVVLEVTVDMKGLVAMGDDLIVFPRPTS